MQSSSVSITYEATIISSSEVACLQTLSSGIVVERGQQQQQWSLEIIAGGQLLFLNSFSFLFFILSDLSPSPCIFSLFLFCFLNHQKFLFFHFLSFY